jgi:hypothetical protein
LLAGSVPRALARDLAPTRVRYGSLVRAWVQTLLHQGVRGVMSNALGLGGDSAPPSGPVPLD